MEKVSLIVELLSKILDTKLTMKQEILFQHLLQL